MNQELIQQFLVNFAPALTVLAGFIAAGLKIISSMKNILSKSNVEELMAQIEAEKGTIADNIQNSKELVEQLVHENVELKKRQEELLEEFTKVKRGE